MTPLHDDPDRDDYLWDGTGTPDPDVVRLETLLAPYRHRGSLTPLPSESRTFDARRPRRVAVHAAMQIMMAAASLVLVLGAAWFASAVRHAGWTV